MLLVQCCILIFISFVPFGCLGAFRRSSCSLSCYLQSESGAVKKSKDVCGFQYIMTDACETGNLKDLRFSTREDTGVNLIQVKKVRPIGASNTAVDLTLRVNVTGEVVLVLSGITDQNESRCLKMCFEKRPDWHSSALKATCVKLPNGFYNATLISYSNTEEDGTLCGTLRDDTAYSWKNVSILSHSRFPVSSSQTNSIYSWDKKKHRDKRGDKPTASVEEILWWQGDDAKSMYSCPCYTCLHTHHTYNNKTALLQLSYDVNTTIDCCSNCKSLNLVLYQYVMVDEEKQCTDLNFTTHVISGLRLVTQDKNVSQGPVEYPNTGSGCYAFRLRPVLNPIPVYHGFFWLNSSGNVINMNDWNTTFYLLPHPMEASVGVRWATPPYPYNFSNYELQLWHSKNESISCRGENLYDSIAVIPETGRISLESTSHTFENLSSGWYCARVTPVDPRCPPDGCEPRSSMAKLLQDPAPYSDLGETDRHVILILIGVGSGVLMAGVILAFVVMRCRALQFSSVSYSKVSGGGRLGEVQEVLLVWTASGVDGSHLSPVIQAFKRILSSYSRCKIYDYLDLRSIPPHQREHLLAAPTAWLDSLLNQHNVKIILVGTEGGRKRQIQWMTTTGGRSEVITDLQPHDAQLFAYLLRRLQDRPDLASDYARVFHVRFNDISGEEAELEGVVSWMRYRLPQHLRSLTLALHGIKEDSGGCLPEPNADVLQELRKTIASHPLHKSQITENSNSHNNQSSGPVPHTHPNNQVEYLSPSNYSDTVPSVLPTTPSQNHIHRQSSSVCTNNNSTAPVRYDENTTPTPESFQYSNHLSSSNTQHDTNMQISNNQCPIPMSAIPLAPSLKPNNHTSPCTKTNGVVKTETNAHL